MEVLGQTLGVLGMILSVASSIAVAAHAGRDSRLMGLAVFFIWPVWLWYVVTNFAEVKVWVGVAVAAFALSFGGGLLGALGGSSGAYAQGAGFGQGKEIYDCEDEAAARIASCGETAACAGNAIDFHQGCLESATWSDGYCDGIPWGSDSKVEAWIAKTCPEMGLSVSDGCRDFLWYIAENCSD